MKKLLLSCVVILLFSFGNSVLAQNVTGKVTSDEDNSGIPGVNIIVKGTNDGVITDVEGNYAIDVSEGDVLSFSFVGFIAEEVAVGTQSVINMTLMPDVAQLEELIVVGYTTQSKRTITGAMAQIDAEAFEKPLNNAAEALQGAATGVTVISDGQPGGSPSVIVRGYASTGVNGPLYIIDGVQTNDASALSEINPSDIESMNVIKDGAASIYGARASNGVIIVTTKAGTYNSKPEFTFDAYTGTQSATNLPDLLNSQQMGDILFEGMVNDGVVPDHPQFGNGGSAVVPEYIRGDPNLPYDAASNVLTRSSNGTKWLDEIFDAASIQNYSMSVRGGSEESKYLMSLGYHNKKGIQRNTGFERFSARLNSDFNITDNITVGEHVSVAYSDRLTSDFSQLAWRNNPLIPLYDEGGNFAGSKAAGLGNTNNPFAELERAKNNFGRSLRLLADSYLEIGFLDGFTAKTSIGVNYRTFNSSAFISKNPENAEVRGNQLTENNFISSGWTWTNTVKYEKTFGDHDLNVLLGTEAVSTNFRQTQVTRKDFLFENPDFTILGAGSGDPIIDFGIGTKSTLASLFGRVGYTFKDRYLATVIVRRDKTSRFIDNTGVFPSISVGWILSEENFLQDVDAISFLKLRLSYGELGNQDIAVSNAALDIFSLSEVTAAYAFAGSGLSAGAFLQQQGNPVVTWETAVQQNLGIDIGLLDNSLELSFDFFNNSQRDLLLQKSKPTTADASTKAPFINVGEVTNKGVDLSVKYNNSHSDSDLKYTVGFNISKYKNDVAIYDPENPEAFDVGTGLRLGAVTRLEQGQPISYFYGRVVDGIFNSAAEVASAPDQGFATDADGVGRFRYKDLNGDNVINDDDRTNIGSPHPDFTFGINGNLSYKNFDLSLFFNGSKGNEIYNYVKIFTDFPTFVNNNRSTRVLDSWSETNQGAALPALSGSLQNNETAPNSYFVEDGSYFRLKNMQIGYTFDQTVLSKIGLNKARVYVQGTNLFTSTNYTGLDPETGARGLFIDGTYIKNLGIDDGSYPLARTYTVGVNFTF